MNDADRISAELNINPEERVARREAFNRMAAEDVTIVERLTIECMVRKTGNPLTAGRIKSAVFHAAETFGLVGEKLPRGYRVLGTGQKTPYYLQMEDDTRPTDAQIVADAMSGWMEEIALLLSRKMPKAPDAR